MNISYADVSEHYLFYLHRRIDMKNSSCLPTYEGGTVFRNVGIQNSDAGKLPRRKQHGKSLKSRKSLNQYVVTTRFVKTLRVQYKLPVL